MVGRDIVYDCVNGHRYKIYEENVKDGMACPECGGYSREVGYASKLWRTSDTLPVYKNNKQKGTNNMQKNSVIELLEKTKGNLVEENRMVESNISECIERLTRFTNRVTDNMKRIDEITEAISKLKLESE